MTRASRYAAQSVSSSSLDSASTGRPAAASSSSRSHELDAAPRAAADEGQREPAALTPEQLRRVQQRQVVLARLVAADAEDHAAGRRRGAAGGPPSRAPVVASGAWIGRDRAATSGPGRPAPASIRRQPRYSFAAASEIATTVSMCGDGGEVEREDRGEALSGGLRRGQRHAVEPDDRGAVAGEPGESAERQAPGRLDGQLRQHVGAPPRDHDGERRSGSAGSAALANGSSPRARSRWSSSSRTMASRSEVQPTVQWS